MNFGRPIEKRKLNGSLITEMEVESESSCRLECVEEERCHSYNFGTTRNNAGRFKCQLSNSDRFSAHANFTEDHHFIYRGIKVILKTNIVSRLQPNLKDGTIWHFI